MSLNCNSFYDSSQHGSITLDLNEKHTFFIFRSITLQYQLNNLNWLRENLLISQWRLHPFCSAHNYWLSLKHCCMYFMSLWYDLICMQPMVSTQTQFELIFRIRNGKNRTLLCTARIGPSYASTQTQTEATQTRNVSTLTRPIRTRTRTCRASTDSAL